MIFYYLDASAWVKRYYREIGIRRRRPSIEGSRAIGRIARG